MASANKSFIISLPQSSLNKSQKQLMDCIIIDTVKEDMENLAESEILKTKKSARSGFSLIGIINSI